EQELTKESLYQKEVDPKLYYDYEGRFIKQKLERDRVALLPRVLKPPMFAKGGHVLGDIRVFERLSVSPLSALTGAFIELPAGGKTDLERQVASQSMYVISGSGQTVQEGNGYDFAAEDVIIVPPYTTHQIVAGPNGARIWAPQVRFWHVLGLLWKDQLELSNIPEGTEPLPNGAGYRVPAGTLGLEEDLEVRTGTEPKRAETFAGRRSVTKKRAGSTKYHW